MRRRWLVAVVVGFALSGGPVARAEAPTTGLVGYWSLDEGAGSVAADSSGGSHPGTLVLGPTWTTGKKGSAISFGGTGYVDIGDIPQVEGLSQVTLTAWMRRGAPNTNVLVGKQTEGHDLAIEFWTDGLLYFDLSNGSYADGYVALNDTSWHHVALVFDGTLAGNENRLKGFVDGVQRSLTFEGSVPATTTANTTPFRIGNLQGDYSTGTVDEVRLYDHALTGNEVQSVMVDAPEPTPAPTPTPIPAPSTPMPTPPPTLTPEPATPTPTPAPPAPTPTFVPSTPMPTFTEGPPTATPSPPAVGAVAPASGPVNGGTLVTVSGSGFVAGAGVTFGGAPATDVSVTSGSAISAISPAHGPGAVSVVVTNPDGLAGNCASCFQYTDPRPVAFPLTVSTDGRSLRDQNGNPFRIQGDAGWSVIANLTYGEADSYLSDRAARGFNAVLVNLLEHKFAVNAPADRARDQPFTRPGDFSTPNPTYFAFADSIIDLAAAKGMLVLLDYTYLGYNGGDEGWWSELNNPTNTQAVCYAFGQYLGARYQNRSNIVWVSGGDFMPPAGSEGEARALKILEGIRSVGGQSRLQTGHWDSGQVSTDELAFTGAMDLNAVYGGNPVYPLARQASAIAPARPVFLIEDGYELEGWVPGDRASIRGYEYGAILSGIAGVFYGHRDVWEFATDTWSSGFPFGHQRWQLSLDAPGAQDMTRMGLLLDSLAWWNLVPSNMNGMKLLITAGGGSYGNSDYVTAGAMPDGSALLAYIPSSNPAPTTISVDMSTMSGPARARWFDPTSGGYLNIGSSLANTGTLAFTTPGANASGTSDWILILDRE